MKKIAAIFFLIIIISLVGFLILRRERYVQVTQSSLHPAMYYEKRGSGIIQCFLCPNQCILSSGQIGICKAKKNIDGELYSMVYGQIAAAHVDPIEKKPIYHMLPGSKAFSIATSGCNFSCKNCQNWQISQMFPWEVESIEMSPEEVVEQALKSGSRSIAYTYSEPAIFYEYMLDIAKLAHQKGLRNIWVTNGYLNPDPLRELIPYLDAANVDLKSFSEEFYQRITGGHLQPVLNTLKIVKESGVHLEVTNLIIPGENDSEEEIRDLIIWIRDNLGADTPLHFSRFHPDYKLKNLPPTPIETIKKARQMAMSLGMQYVYTGNILDPEGNATYCPTTGETVIKRQSFFITENNLKDGKCSDGYEIPGVWN